MGRLGVVDGRVVKEMRRDAGGEARVASVARESFARVADYCGGEVGVHAQGSAGTGEVA